MTDVRYQVPGVPPGPAAGLSAFTPAFVRHAASSAASYKYAARGYPGTRGIPIDPVGQGIPPSPDPGDMAMMGGARSLDAPNAFWPNLYYQAYAVERPGGYDNTQVAVYDPVRPGLTTVLPVPAQDWRGLYTRESNRDIRRAVLQRAKALPWFPRVLKLKEGTWNG